MLLSLSLAATMALTVTRDTEHKPASQSLPPAQSSQGVEQGLCEGGAQWAARIGYLQGVSLGRDT